MNKKEQIKLSKEKVKQDLDNLLYEKFIRQTIVKEK